MTHLAGEILQSRYEIEATLGSGGMGGVYLATHRALDVKVAIKEMTVAVIDAQDKDSCVRQFKKEAQILHALRHPNLPRVHDFFDEDGRYYLVMDYIEGKTLEQVVVAGPVSEATVLHWTLELCSVLDYLHHHDPPIIFRDLKPSNIMLATDGHVKLIDFGIAKDLDRSTGRGTQTSVRGSGTPGFAAPEQYGAGSDVRTDIYALGATVYALLARVVPPDSVEIASGGAELTPLRDLRPDVSPSTAKVIEWMLNVNRTQRPASIEEVSAALGAGALPPSDRVPRAESLPLPLTATERKTLIEADQPALFEVEAPVAVSHRAFGFFMGSLLLLLGALGAWAWVHRPGARPVMMVSYEISSNPPGAKLYVEGKKEGDTPCKLTGRMHERVDLVLEKDGYNMLAVPYEISPGAPKTYTLTPVPHQLTIDGTPPDAWVEIDTQSVGRGQPGGLKVNVTPGVHEVHLHQDGYVETFVRINVPEVGNPSPLRYQLNGLPPQLTVKAQAGATVVIDGAIAPGGKASFKKDGSHRVQVAAPGFQSFDAMVAAKAGPPTVVDVSLTRPGQPAPKVPPVEATPPDQSTTATATPPAPTVSANAGAASRGTLVVPGQTLGPFAVGVPAQPYLDQLHMIFVTTEPLKGISVYESPNRIGREPEFRMSVGKGGRLLRVGTSNPAFKTAAGVGVGSSRADVFQAYGTDWEEEKRWGGINSRSQGIGFNFRGDTVLFVHVEVLRTGPQHPR